jgi:hypothetical protein
MTDIIPHTDFHADPDLLDVSWNNSRGTLKYKEKDLKMLLTPDLDLIVPMILPHHAKTFLPRLNPESQFYSELQNLDNYLSIMYPNYSSFFGRYKKDSFLVTAFKFKFDQVAMKKTDTLATELYLDDSDSVSKITEYQDLLIDSVQLVVELNLTLVDNIITLNFLLYQIKIKPLSLDDF